MRIIKWLLSVATSYYNRPVVDWSGSWSSGTLTLPGISQCNRAEVTIGGQVINGDANSSRIVCSRILHSQADEAGSMFAERVVLIMTGDTLTYAPRRLLNLLVTPPSIANYQSPITRIRAWRV